MGLLHRVLVCLFLACSSAVAQAPLDIRIALVIGNAGYAGPAALQNPIKDAEAMSATLRVLGFNVMQLRDASLAQTRDAIAAAQGQMTGKQAIGLLYYAGHGLQMDSRNFMVPVDAKLASASDVAVQAIDVAQVVEGFRRAGSRMNIVVLDACRDNPFAGGPSAQRGLAPMDAPAGTFLAYATAPGNVAEDGDDATGHGLYTGYLVKELQKPATRIEDVFKRVRLLVRQRSNGRQVPWESTSLEEDFFFNDGVKHTFGAGELQRVADAALARQAQLKREAEQEQEKSRQDAALNALEQLRVAEAQRLKQLEAAAQQAQQNERLGKLAKEDARQQSFSSEKRDWDRIKDSQSADDFFSFLQKYPSGYISEQAQFRLDQLQKERIQAQVGGGHVQSLPSGARRFAVGDELVYDRIDGFTKSVSREVSRVTFADDERVEFDGGREIWDQMGGQLLTRYGKKEPAVAAVPAQIWVGKKWRSAYTNTASSGERSEAYYDFKVVALEEVTVPAGRFLAYKIERAGDLRGQGWYAVQTGTSWVDPATMQMVRIDSFSRRDGRIAVNESFVLVSSKRAPRKS